MRTTRIHVAQALAQGRQLRLPDQTAEHLVRVLRLRTGARLVLFNGDGYDYEAVILAADRREICVRVERRILQNRESHLPLTLAQGMARGEKMDLIVQKATELGVQRIVPLITERCEVKLDAHRAQKRLAHWCAIAISACAQCGRTRLPTVEPIKPLATWLDTLENHAQLRLALLPEASQQIGNLSVTAAGATIAVGPEGGFADRDVMALRSAGFYALRLGPRILRTETAGWAALVALQALHGDLY